MSPARPSPERIEISSRTWLALLKVIDGPLVSTRPPYAFVRPNYPTIAPAIRRSHLLFMSKFTSFVPPSGTVNRFDPSRKAAGTISFWVGAGESSIPPGACFTVVIITMYSPATAPLPSLPTLPRTNRPSPSVSSTNGPGPCAFVGEKVTAAFANGLPSRVTLPSTGTGPLVPQPAHIQPLTAISEASHLLSCNMRTITTSRVILATGYTSHRRKHVQIDIEGQKASGAIAHHRIHATRMNAVPAGHTGAIRATVCCSRSSRAIGRAGRAATTPIA